MFIPTHPRERSPWLLSTMLILALLTLSGCAEVMAVPGVASGPLAVPSPLIFLEAPEPRALGPLRTVAESEVRIVHRDPPPGTVVVGKTVLDMDAAFRAGDERRSFEMRFTQHKIRVRRTQLLGRTEEGAFRFRVDYPRDQGISLVRQQRSTKAGLVDGRGYIVEIGPRGRRVATAGGQAPRPAEASFVLDDCKDLRPPREDRRSWERDADEVLTTDRIARVVRASLVRADMRVGDVKVSFKGTRDVAGVPCAVFDLAVSAHMDQTQTDQSTSIEMELSGEYAFRLEDGREADLLLTGTMSATGHVRKYGLEIPVNALGFMRIYVALDYREPATLQSGATASR